MQDYLHNVYSFIYKRKQDYLQNVCKLLHIVRRIVNTLCTYIT